MRTGCAVLHLDFRAAFGTTPWREVCSGKDEHPGHARIQEDQKWRAHAEYRPVLADLLVWFQPSTCGRRHHYLSGTESRFINDFGIWLGSWKQTLIGSGKCKGSSSSSQRRLKI